MLEFAYLPDAKFHTFIRGCKENSYIILDYPLNPGGTPLNLKELLRCVVRFLFQGKVYGFQSEIQKIARYPYPFIFINYPREIDCINLRKTSRIPLRIPVVYCREPIASSPAGYPTGYLLDLSDNGCLLETTEPLETGAAYFLSFELPNQDLIKNLPAQIKRVARKENSYHQGTMFQNTEGPEMAKVQEYLSYLKRLQLQA